MAGFLFRSFNIFLLLLVCNNLIYSGKYSPKSDTSIIESTTDTSFLVYTSSEWVDSVYKSFSSDERIAQLLMIAAYSNRDKQSPVNSRT